MPPKISAIDSNDTIVTNLETIERLCDVDKNTALGLRKEQDRVLAEYKKLFPLVEKKQSLTKGEGSDQATSAASRGGPSGSKDTGSPVRPAVGATFVSRRLKKNPDVVLPGGSVGSLPGDVRPHGDVASGTIPVGHQSGAGEEPAEGTSSGEFTDSDDGVDQWIAYQESCINNSKVLARADRVKDAKGKIKSSMIPGPSHEASNDNFELIMNALGRISNRLEDSDRRFEALRVDLDEQRSLNQIPAHPGLDANVQRDQGTPKFPRDSSSRGAFNYTHRAKSHKYDNLTHEDEEVYEDYESSSQFRPDDVGDQEDQDENALDDTLDG